MQTNFYDKIQELRNTDYPFTIATVVRAEKPTYAKAGAILYIPLNHKLSGPVPIGVVR
ncbi:MAG: hypothetical protein Fur0022_06610 [Anaerolineales bacterium]